MNKVMSAFVAFCIAILSFVPVQASEAISVKYIQSMLPKLSLCIDFSGNEPKQNEVMLLLGDEKLQIESIEKFNRDNHQEKIYVLLDLSTSMRQTYFDAIKTSLRNLIENSGDNRDITLVTFGNGTPIFYEETEAVEVLSSLRPNEEGTKINEVINETILQARNLAFKQYDLLYGIVISDGVEYSKGSTTLTEIQRSLQQLPMAFYGLCTDYSSSETMNSFRSLMVETNGKFEQFNLNNLDEKLSQTIQNAENVYIVNAVASTNLAVEKNLSVKYKGASENLTVSLKSSIDTEEPQITDWQYDKKNKTLNLTVSEELSTVSVKNGSVTLLRNGKQKYLPWSFVYSNGKQLELSFDQAIPNGTYEVSFLNITDTSDNQNPLQNCTVEITNSYSPFVLWLFAYWFIPVIIVCIVLLIVIIVAVLKKKKGILSVRELISTDKEEKISLRSDNGKKIHLFIEDSQGHIQDFEMLIAQSKLFGRSHNLCDVAFSDPKMSRQHFSIGVEDDVVYIQDLSTKNGTFLNGSKFTGTEILHSGDKIIAGQNTITVEF